MKNWKWFGNHGHFICGRYCRFHLTTLVNNRWLISTLGEMYLPGREDVKYPGETIGYDRFYESMVFEAGAPCSSEECSCGLPSISGSELDFKGYNRADEATKGHYELCEKWESIQDAPKSEWED